MLTYSICNKGLLEEVSLWLFNPKMFQSVVMVSNAALRSNRTSLETSPLSQTEIPGDFDPFCFCTLITTLSSDWKSANRFFLHSWSCDSSTTALSSGFWK
ncbi:hypothetical protein EXN66_Car009063 [Channa argus]|uniref:Uncharacterized protein n=1 Tax=Channa argus TaxID=215402 RepID=A0A6G1PT30_CHAAH|nr:hypothetical protein EXN66_Car009063 [Channa argus]